MKTMHDEYGDGSDHEVCEKCGFCKTCDDCRCADKTIKARLIKITIVAGVKKARWECPYCKNRFNLSIKREKDHRCNKCLNKLEVKK